MRLNSGGLFTANQIAEALSVSRSTLLRIEQEGLVEPIYIGKVRYYDLSGYMQLRRVIGLHMNGMTREQIRSILQCGDFDEPIRSLKDKLRKLQAQLDELTFYSELSPDPKPGMKYLPSMACISEERTIIFGDRDMHTLGDDLFSRTVEHHLKIDMPSNPCLIFPDLRPGMKFPEPGDTVRVILNVPVIDNGSDEIIRARDLWFLEQRVRGSMRDVPERIDELWKEAERIGTCEESRFCMILYLIPMNHGVFRYPESYRLTGLAVTMPPQTT